MEFKRTKRDSLAGNHTEVVYELEIEDGNLGCNILATPFNVILDANELMFINENDVEGFAKALGNALSDYIALKKQLRESILNA